MQLDHRGAAFRLFYLLWMSFRANGEWKNHQKSEFLFSPFRIHTKFLFIFNPQVIMIRRIKTFILIYMTESMKDCTDYLFRFSVFTPFRLFDNRCVFRVKIFLPRAQIRTLFWLNALLLWILADFLLTQATCATRFLALYLFEQLRKWPKITNYSRIVLRYKQYTYAYTRRVAQLGTSLIHTRQHIKT